LRAVADPGEGELSKRQFEVLHRAVILLAGISLLLPGRGLQERLVGTWPVPR
jgi:hypothetical protein